MSGDAAPARCLGCGFDGVSDILAVSKTGLANAFALHIQNRIAVARVRPHLFAADEKFCCSVDILMYGCGGGQGGKGRCFAIYQQW